jgi:LCP family protein required for cell wall assembly
MSDGENATPGQHDDVSSPESTGNHTEGIAVADLIAKLTGSSRVAPVTRRSADARAPDDAAITVPISMAPPADELPDLAALARARRPLVANRNPAAGRAPQPQPVRRRRPALLAARSAAVLIAVSALAVTGAAWQWQSAKNKLLNTIVALDPNSSDIRDPGAQNGDENFLIIGVDSRIGANGEMGAGDTSVAEGARSDTIMLVNIPANRKRVVAVSFPRDLAIAPMNCQAWDPETGKYGPVYDKTDDEWSDNERLTTTKLNSAYALGGPKCLVKVIQKISGLAINRFMAVDFAGFSAMVDALGGVEVCSTTPLEDAELGTVLADAGRQKLDGSTALNYVRARSITTEYNGDYGRIKRQQLFLSSLLRSMISTDTLFDLDKLDQVVNTFIDDSFVDNVQTRDLVRLGQSLQGMNAGRITFVTVPTTGYADDEGNEQPRTEDIQALFDAIIDDKPLPGENDNNETLNPMTVATKAAETTSVATPTEAESDTGYSADTNQTITEQVKAVAADPRDVTVQVANATDQSGLADTATGELESFSFAVLEPDYYSDWSTVTETTVFYSLGNEQAAATVATSLPGAQIERISGLGETVQVVLGPDFGGVKYPQASGTPLIVSVTHAGSSTPTKLPSDLTVTNGADVTCE